MSFLKFLFGRSKVINAGIIVLSFVNGIFSMCILLLLTSISSGQRSVVDKEYLWFTFWALFFFSFLLGWLFQRYMVKLTSSMHYEYEINIFQRLRNATFQDFEKLSHETVYTAFSDIKCLVTIPELTLKSINALITVTTAVAYLLIVNIFAGLILLALMGALFTIYIIRNQKTEIALTDYRRQQDDQMRFSHHLMDGFREIYMSERRRRRIHDDFLVAKSRSMRMTRESVENRYLANELMGRYSWYLIIGIVVMILPLFGNFSNADIGNFIITILYLMGSVSVLVSVIPGYTYAKISGERLNAFESLLDSRIPKTPTTNAVDARTIVDHIRFEDVIFRYNDDKGNQTFSFGPINVELEKNQIIFVTGGNGSGKSTFINLLTGLYRPDDGRILINNTPVGDDNYDDYRQHISAIFTNPYLFNENYDGFDLRPSNPKINELLRLLNLKEQVQYSEQRGVFSPNVSRGQQKRLAMINALLEDRPVMVLDEWAAEQDPHFRKYFYNTMLPELRAKGKTVIVVTHDDTYFHCSDRVIRFEYGKILSERTSVIA